MLSIPALILTGPCLLMGMAALSLFVVHNRLSRVRHAFTWGCACLASAAQWAIMGAQGIIGTQLLHGGRVADLLGLGAVLLIGEGFRLRAGKSSAALVIPVAAVAGGILLLLPGIPSAARPAIQPLIGMCVLGWAATLIATHERRTAAAEIAVVAVLSGWALVDLLAGGAAIAEWAGILPSHHLYVVIYAFTVEPAAAALALALLLLIAFDFAVELRRLLHTDPLTGVLNRMGLVHAAEIAFERARSRPLCLAVADIDFFKQVNDRHGHAVGDATLVAFAAHLATAAPREGSVARIGGEEFALLLPGLHGATALVRTEALRRSLAEVRLADEPGLAVRASFGIAEHRVGEALDQLLARADQALYRSKRSGRDRSTLAEPDEPVAA